MDPSLAVLSKFIYNFLVQRIRKIWVSGSKFIDPIQSGENTDITNIN